MQVDFDSDHKVFDIVISIKTRRNYGKGKKAIAYTACLLGLLDYCLVTERSFSNLLIIDSPLTTFKGKKEITSRVQEELELKDKVKNLFFKDLTETSKNCQVIIFDNELPSKELFDKLNTQTDDLNEGRQGFFPK